MTEAVLFYLFSLVAIVAGLSVVLARNPIASGSGQYPCASNGRGNDAPHAREPSQSYIQAAVQSRLQAARQVAQLD